MRLRSFILYRNQKAQVLTEYLIATIFLSLMVWYAIVGGSVDETGEGGLNDLNGTPGTGTYLDKQHTDALAMPGLVHVLHKKQKTFAKEIYGL